MKARLVNWKQEGFLSAQGIQFDNGFVLRGPNLLWLGKAGTEKTEKQFSEVVEALKKGEVKIDE